MAPGTRSKFGAPMFEPEFFRKQMCCIEESTCDIVRTFWRPRSDSAPGELCPPCPPRYAPGNSTDKNMCNLHKAAVGRLYFADTSTCTWKDKYNAKKHFGQQRCLQNRISQILLHTRDQEQQCCQRKSWSQEQARTLTAHYSPPWKRNYR